ncbi:MAG: prepilin-type N-terminal cleavage/methylation domain-containing protein [Clostridium beijerinckii]
MNQLSVKKLNELSKKKKKGFTLVELIIVIAIIAILAAIAIPKFGQIRNSANQKADVATAKNIATVVAAAIADNRISATQTAAEITALDPATGSTDVSLADEIDGATTPKATGHTAAFTVTVTNGNIVVNYGDGGKGQVYPEGSSAS